MKDKQGRCSFQSNNILKYKSWYAKNVLSIDSLAKFRNPFVSRYRWLSTLPFSTPTCTKTLRLHSTWTFIFWNSYTRKRYFRFYLFHVQWNGDKRIAELKLQLQSVSNQLFQLLQLFQLFQSHRYNRKNSWNSTQATSIPENYRIPFPGDSRSWESPEKADNVRRLFIQILLR